MNTGQEHIQQPHPVHIKAKYAALEALEAHAVALLPRLHNQYACRDNQTCCRAKWHMWLRMQGASALSPLPPSLSPNMVVKTITKGLKPDWVVPVKLSRSRRHQPAHTG